MKLTSIDIEQAMIYMGSRGRDTSPLEPLVNECEKELLAEVSPQYIYRVFPISFQKEGVRVEGTDLVLTGSAVREHLEGCSRCVLLCATLSAAADKLIRQQAAYDMARSFVTDCLASAAVESVCDAAEQEIRSKLRGCFFTWRYSPGYGDLPLELQRDFLAVLDAQKRIGLNVTDSHMLVPTKSVTAIIGVSDKEISKSRKGCLDCNMYESCPFRKGGYHCGT